MSFDSFSDFPLADGGNETAAPVDAPAAAPPAAPADEDYRSHIHALIDANATADQVRAYVQSIGADPSKITGLDEAIAAHKLKQSFGVSLQGEQAPEAATQPQHDDFSDFPEATPADETMGDSALHGAGLAGRAALRAAGQIADVLALPIRGLDKLDQLVTPNRIRGPMGSVGEIAEQGADDIGLPAERNNFERLTTAGTTGALGGLMTAGLAAPLAAESPLAATIANSSGAEALAGGGSGTAAEGARQQGFGPTGQILAAIVGGPAALVTGAGARRAASTIAGTVTGDLHPNDLLAAFQRQQVQPMAAQVGGFGSKMMTTGAKATLGGLPLAAAAEKSIATAKAARDRIAAMMGNVRDDTGAGQAVQRGVKSFIDNTALKAKRLYDAIPIASDRPAVLSNTKQALADLNAGLASNPELSAMLSDGRLQGYEAALSGKPTAVPTGLLDANGAPITRSVTKGGALSWQDLKAFRSYIGELAGRPTMQESTSKEALQRLYAGLSEDMKATAASHSPDALKAFQRANNFYRARQSRIEDTLKLVLGNDYLKSPEDAFGQIDRWAREGGDAARLARTIRSLPEDEAATVRATIFSRMGRAAPGQQNAAVDAFSPASFGTQWAKLDHRAKSILFPGVEYRQSLDDIAKISQAMKESEKFANTSGTALAERLGKNLFGATVVGYILHPTAAIAGEGVGYAGGMLLANPRFAKWVASTARKPNGPATLAHINRLSSIAAAEPAIANEVLALQERLASAFRAQPLAAQQEDHKQ